MGSSYIVGIRRQKIHFEISTSQEMVVSGSEDAQVGEGKMGCGQWRGDAVPKTTGIRGKMVSFFDVLFFFFFFPAISLQQSLFEGFVRSSKWRLFFEVQDNL